MRARSASRLVAAACLQSGLRGQFLTYKKEKRGALMVTLVAARGAMAQSFNLHQRDHLIGRSALFHSLGRT